MSERFVTSADGIELYVREYGVGSSAVPVVCVAGLTRNSRDFERVAPGLAGDRQVLALDLRGRGRSGYDASGASYWVDVYASDVLTVMDAFGIVRACLVGESLGGIVSMRVATIAGARVAGVVLNDIGPDLDPAGVARIFSYAGKLPPVVTWDDAVAQCRLMSESAAPGLSDEQWREIARQRFREDGDGTVVIDYDTSIATASVPVQSAADRWDDFESLRDIPTLSIRGAMSDVLARETVAEMRVRKPDLQTVEIAGRGHCPIPHEPECLAVITRFVASLPG